MRWGVEPLKNERRRRKGRENKKESYKRRGDWIRGVCRSWVIEIERLHTAGSHKWRWIESGPCHYYLTNLLWARRGLRINDTVQDNRVISPPCKWPLLWVAVVFLSLYCVGVHIYKHQFCPLALFPWLYEGMLAFKFVFTCSTSHPVFSIAALWHHNLYLPSEESTHGFFLLSSPDFDAERRCQYCTDSIRAAASSQQGLILTKASHLKGCMKC